jgi:hypothetical protein
MPCDAPPNFLKYSNANSKVKTLEKEEIRMRSFIHNTRGREGRGEEVHARALEWGLG